MERPPVKIPGNILPLEVENSLYRSVLDHVLTAEDLDKARLELKETEEKRLSCLSTLKEKLSKDEQVNYQMDDYFLTFFLRVRKFDIDRAYEMVSKYYRVKRDYPQFFTVFDNYEDLIPKLCFRHLPFRHEEGFLMVHIKPGNWNTEEMSFKELMSMTMSLADILSANPACQVYGMFLIMDAASVSWTHARAFTHPSTFYAILSLLQSCYPWRNKKVVFFNTNSIARTFWSVIKPFMKTKLAKRVFFLGNDFSELHEHVSPEILPAELGGTLDEKHFQPLEQYFRDNINYVKYVRSFGYVN